MRAIAALVIIGAALAGCVASEDSPDITFGVYQPHLHIHNIWHEFLQDGRITLHQTIVNTGNETVKYLRIAREVNIHYQSNGTERTRVGADVAREFNEYPPRAAREFSWTGEPPAFDPTDRPYYWYQIDISSYSAGGARFVSACYRSDGDAIVNATADGLYDSCAPRYWVNSQPFILKPTHREFIHPHDPEYQELVWECCRLRSLPAYDAQEAWPIPATGALEANRSFPVQEGAVNGSVSAAVRLPGAAWEGAMAGMARVWVEDPRGAVVAEGEGNLSAGHVRAELPSFGALGVYRAFVEARGPPGAEVALEVRVNDGVRPDR